MTQNRSIYLNTAACGLIFPDLAQPAIDFYKDMATKGSIRAFSWMNQEEAETRELVANFLDAPKENIAIIPSFSFGMNAVVQSLTGQERILLYEKDYPSLTNPFLVNNFKTVSLKDTDGFHLDLKQLEHILSEGQADIFAVSHVQYLTGACVPLKEIVDICHRYLVPVIVDTTQSMGAMRISIRDCGVDVLIGSNYKWMNAGFASGLIYISDNFLKKHPPVYGGVKSYEEVDGKMVRKPSVLDLEPGHLSMEGLCTLKAAISDKNKRGLGDIQAYNNQLTEKFLKACKELPATPVGPYSMEGRCSIVVLKDENGLGDWLVQNGFIVTLRNQTIRLGFHYYNNSSEVDALIECISKLPKTADLSSTK